MIMMAGFELPIKAMRTQISSAVDLIIQANRLQGGPRKVTRITEVCGMENDTIVMQDIFKFDKTGVDENGRATVSSSVLVSGQNVWTSLNRWALSCQRAFSVNA